MAIESSEYLKNRFQRRDKPQEGDYTKLMESFLHKRESHNRGLYAELLVVPYTDFAKYEGTTFTAEDVDVNGGLYRCYLDGWKKDAGNGSGLGTTDEKNVKVDSSDPTAKFLLDAFDSSGNVKPTVTGTTSKKLKLDVDLTGVPTSSQLNTLSTQVTSLSGSVTTLNTSKAENTRVDTVEAEVNTLKNFNTANGIVLQDGLIPAQYIPVKGTKTVANITERNAYILTISPSSARDGVPVLVIDDGDGKWAEYKYILSTTSWLKTGDEDTQGPLSLEWASITNVPTEFTPAAHTQNIESITGLNSQLSTLGVNITTAQNTATTAQTTASNAATTAATAQTTAATAQTTATNAASTANTANTNATAALNAANTASTTAASALSVANSKQADLGIVLVDGKIPVDKLPSQAAASGAPFVSYLNVYTDTYPLPPSPSEDDRPVQFFGYKTPPPRANGVHFKYLQHVVASITNLLPTSFTASWSSIVPSDGYRMDVVRVVGGVETTHQDFANKLIAAGSGTISVPVTGLTASSVYRVRVRNTSGTKVSQNYEIEFTTPAAALTKFAKLAALNMSYYYNFGSALAAGKMPSTPAATPKAMTLVGGVLTGQTSLDSTQAGNLSIKLDGTTGYLTLAFTNEANEPITITLERNFALGVMCKFANTNGARPSVALSNTGTNNPYISIESGAQGTADGRYFYRNNAGTEVYDTNDVLTNALPDEGAVVLTNFVNLQTHEAALIGVANGASACDLYGIKDGVTTFLGTITPGAVSLTHLSFGVRMRTVIDSFANIFGGYIFFHNGSLSGLTASAIADIHNTGTRA